MPLLPSPALRKQLSRMGLLLSLPLFGPCSRSISWTHQSNKRTGANQVQIKQTVGSVPAMKVTAITPGTTGYTVGANAFYVEGSGTFGPMFRVQADGGIYMNNY